jgi:C4-dicarboxylate-specific signal transduction histidine kinase
VVAPLIAKANVPMKSMMVTKPKDMALAGTGSSHRTRRCREGGAASALSSLLQPGLEAGTPATVRTRRKQGSNAFYAMEIAPHGHRTRHIRALRIATQNAGTFACLSRSINEFICWRQ